MNTNEVIALAVIIGIFLFGLALVVTGHGIGGGSEHHAYRDPLDPKDDLK